MKYLVPSETQTTCPWKGEASYFSIKVGELENNDAAWTYATPTKEASRLKNYFAFWKGVEIKTESDEARNKRISSLLKEFANKIQDTKDDESTINETKSMLENMGADALFHTLPTPFIDELSFFNFQNSNNLCFHCDHEQKVRAVNPTLEWALNHLPGVFGKTLECFIDLFDVIEGPSNEEFFKTLESHGWVRIPKLRTMKGDRAAYYTLDVAITKHGELDSLKGFQGELVDITMEVELSQSLAQSESNMKSLLAGLNEGLFFFNQDGSIPPERSQALERILPKIRSCSSLQDIVSHYSKVGKDNVDTCLQLLWEDDDSGFFSDFATTVSMLPKQVEISDGPEKQYVVFEYRPLYAPDESLDKVIVIVSDITEQLRNEKDARKQAERVKKLGKVASNQEAYMGFTQEAHQLFERADKELRKSGNDRNVKQIQRDLHTLKGSIGTFEFTYVAHLIHQLEDKISEGDLDNSLNQTVDFWSRLYQTWSDEICDIDVVLGLSKSLNNISVDRKKLENIKNLITGIKDSSLSEAFDALLRHAPSKVFQKYEDYLDTLNRKYPNKKVRVAYAEESCELGFEEVQALDGALIHILRNCFDHGIEDSSARSDSGKDETGIILIKSHRTQDTLEIQIKDDGGGIDGDKLAQKAVESGLWSEDESKNASHEKKINLIFAANLSSKDEVTDVSGRGVGMDAVKSFVEELGGEILIESKKEQGSSFTIKVPNVNQGLQHRAA